MSILGFTSKEYKDDRGREYFFDNAKFIIIMLVVIAHFISPLKSDGRIVSAGWLFINAFHMPVLILISGYFAKGYITKDGKIKYQRLCSYIIYYLAAQTAVSLFEIYVLKTKEAYVSIVYPRTSLWYLMCLICWYLVLPVISKFDPKKTLIMAVLFAVWMGYDKDANSVMSITRVFNHFPLFLVGYYYKKEWLFKFRNKKTQAAAVVILAVLLALTYKFQDFISGNVITSNYAYARCELKFLTDDSAVWLHRVGYYVIALTMSACVLLLVPRGKAIYSRFGSRTLQVYILHRFLYLSELEYGWADSFINMRFGGVCVVLIAMATTVILSLKPFEYPFKLLGKIKPMELLAKKEQG